MVFSGAEHPQIHGTKLQFKSASRHPKTEATKCRVSLTDMLAVVFAMDPYIEQPGRTIPLSH